MFLRHILATAWPPPIATMPILLFLRLISMRAYPADKIEIASNTAKIQAVRNKDLNIWQIVFHEKGSFTSADLNVTVDKPCILMLKNVGQSQVTVFAADPTQIQRTLNIGIKTSELGPNMRGIVLNLPAQDFAGSTVKGMIDINTPEQTTDTTSLQNLALGKSSKQSTTYSTGAASKAVDGNTDGGWNQGSISHTLETESPPS